jgi:hypothetical protein
MSLTTDAADRLHEHSAVTSTVAYAEHITDQGEF